MTETRVARASGKDGVHAAVPAGSLLDGWMVGRVGCVPEHYVSAPCNNLAYSQPRAGGQALSYA